jgi:beta-galactosidase
VLIITSFADGSDLSFITVKVTDGMAWLFLMHNKITFSIEGAGEIVAADNGDP